MSQDSGYDGSQEPAAKRARTEFVSPQNLVRSLREARTFIPDKGGMAETGTAVAGGQNKTGRFIQQQGGYFVNNSQDITHTHEFLTKSKYTNAAKTGQTFIGNIEFNPVNEINVSGGGQFFYTFQEAKLDKIELILYTPNGVNGAIPDADAYHVWLAPWNKPFNQTGDSYADPMYLPSAVYKYVIVNDQNVSNPTQNELIRTTIENPAMFIDLRSGLDNRYANTAVNQFFPTIFTGNVLAQPRYNGLILKFVSKQEQAIQNLSWPAAVKYTFSFRGWRMARGPAREFPTAAAEQPMQDLTVEEHFNTTLETGKGNDVISEVQELGGGAKPSSNTRKRKNKSKDDDEEAQLKLAWKRGYEAAIKKVRRDELREQIRRRQQNMETECNETNTTESESKSSDV